MSCYLSRKSQSLFFGAQFFGLLLSREGGNEKRANGKISLSSLRARGENTRKTRLNRHLDVSLLSGLEVFQDLACERLF